MHVQICCTRQNWIRAAFVAVFAVLAFPAGQALAAPPQKNSADLRISMTDYPDPAMQGGELTYSITVTNDGPATATSVQVYDDLLSADVVSFSTSQGTCETGVVCHLGSLTKGSSVSVTIVVRPASAGTLTNTVEVSSNTPDPRRNNDVATVTTTVEPDPYAPLAACMNRTRLEYGLFLHQCDQYFSLDQTANLRLALQPGPDFIGKLHAEIISISSDGYYVVVGEVTGFFVNGLLVAGSAETVVGSAAGPRLLRVSAGEYVPPYPCVWWTACISNSVPASGLFGAAVTRTPD